MGESWSYLNEGQVGYESLDFTNDFGFGGGVKRLEHDVEYGLLLWLLL